MPSAVLFSNASFDEPAQATVLRSIESVKRKALEDDTIKLYESYCDKNEKIIEKKSTLASSSSSNSILEFVDIFEEQTIINTISESQPLKVDVTSDLKPLVKKRKLKIIPNKIECPKKIIVDSTNNTVVNYMKNVSLHFLLPIFFNQMLIDYMIFLILILFFYIFLRVGSNCTERKRYI